MKYREFIGRGITFPIELNGGKPEIKTGRELIKSSVFIILQWVEGTKFFQGQFGSKLELLLQEPNQTVVQGMLETYIRDAVEEWEKRVTVQNVSVRTANTNPDEVNPGALEVELTYQEVRSKKEDSFIYPFYQKAEV